MNRLIGLLALAILVAGCATQSVERRDTPEAEVRTAPEQVELPEDIPAPVGGSMTLLISCRHKMNIAWLK